MPKLDGTGPEGEGSRSGRKLGKCSNATEKEKLKKLGKGMGKKRLSGGGEGKGKRLKSGLK
ncbi:MAG: DUF5320 domain-containing protein [Bacteroidetes bacterium]|nr:DUF5320 domain-containing protein [Bacteroidota bacterium]